MAKTRGYLVLAAVYHIPPPIRKVKVERMAIFDSKGRMVESVAGGTLDEYEGRFSKRMLRRVVAAEYAFYGYPVTERDVRLMSAKMVERRERAAKTGGFQMHVYAENVPAEKTLYLKGIYRLDLGERAYPETRAIDYIQTEGNETKEEQKALVSNYIRQRFGYCVEPDEIFFINKKGWKKFEKKTEGV